MPRTSPGRTRQQVYEFMRRRLVAGQPPSTREVQQHFGFKAVQSARQHLEALVAEGRLAKEAGRARGYRLPDTVSLPGPVKLVPQLGRVQAGALSEAIEDPDGYILVDDIQDDMEMFALTVRGESMLGAGILPGDTVLVRRQDTAREGDVVVALVGDEATVKRLSLRSGRVELHAENPAFAPIVPADGVDFRILGRVVEVRRKLV